MSRFAFSLVSILCIIAGRSWCQEIRYSGSAQDTNNTQVRASNSHSLQAILNVLYKANLSGSIEISGRCSSLNDQSFPDVPKIRAPKANGGTALETLRAMFAGDPVMHVTQDADGAIRMVESGTANDILKIKIGHVSFDSSMEGAYNANSILEAILASHNMKLYMDSNAIKWPIAYQAASVIFPTGSTPPPVPHVDTSLGSETLLEALDRVLKAFPGIWLYENCPATNARDRIVYFRFYHLQNTLYGTVVE